jgi:ATP-dependent helicase/nuclease subunit A
MTRAAERLIVCGVQPGNRNEEPKSSWYRLVTNGLEGSELVEQSFKADDGVIRRFTRRDDTFAAVSAPQRPKQAELVLPPHWLHEKPEAVEPAFEFRRPSDAENEGHQFARNESPRDRQRALRRGVLVHRLLQSLPDVPADRRRAAAELYLVRNTARNFPDAEREALTAQTLGLLADARFATLFAPGSRAEVPIVGRIARPGRKPLSVSGQIDRLITTDSEILIADYKTNHAPPREFAGVPKAYRQQLALYRALLQRLYPGRSVRAVLVWTETPEIMEIPASVLDDEMIEIISA